MPFNLRKHIYRFKRLLKKEELKLYIDVAHCNLRCAMCPRGGIGGLNNEGKGLMDFDVFKRIIDKFIKERVKISHFEIGSWGEPLLNPDLPRMIRYIKDECKPVWMGQDGRIGVSTSLNYLKNPAEFLESGVTYIRVSISGMRQEVYSKNHIGGNIDTVLGNVLKLVDIKNARNLNNVSLAIGFQELVYNKNDMESAKEFCRKYGLRFELINMYIPSVEDNIEFHKNREKFSELYSKFIDLRRETASMKLAKNVERCQFRRSTITINYDGQLYRCCGVFEQKYSMGSFFEYNIRDIPKTRSEICKICATTPMSWR